MSERSPTRRHRRRRTKSTQPRPAKAQQRQLFSEAVELTDRAFEALTRFQVDKAVKYLELAREIDAGVPAQARLTEVARFLQRANAHANLDPASLSQLWVDARAAYVMKEISLWSLRFAEVLICGTAAAKVGRRIRGYLDPEKPALHIGFCYLLLGDYVRAHRKLFDDLIRRPAGGYGDLWGYLGDAAYELRFAERSNKAYVRAFFGDPDRVDLSVLRHHGLRQLYTKLRERYDEAEARRLLPIHAWLESILVISPEDGAFRAYVARQLKTSDRVQDRQGPEGHRRFALLLYHDQSREEPGDVHVRAEMQRIDPALFSRFEAKVERFTEEARGGEVRRRKRSRRTMNVEKFTDYRRYFPSCRRYVYLNHAAMSPLPTPVVEAMNELLTDFSEHGITHLGDWTSRLEEGRRAFARLIGARPEEIAYIRNTSEGVVIAAFGVDWRAGDNVVLVDQEFPANVLPWIHAAQRFEVTPRFVKPNPDGRIDVDDLAAQIDRRTRALAISFVQFATGYRCDLNAIGALCRDRGVMLFVDGIQGVGALPLDVSRTPVDILACGGHKWLLGPAGTGFLYVRRPLLDRLQPVLDSWVSVEEPFDFLLGERDRPDYEKPLSRTASRFEGGAANLVGFVGLAAAVQFLSRFEVEEIAARIFHLGDLVIAGLVGKRYEIVSPRHAWERSGIVVFRHPQRDTRELFRELNRRAFRLAMPCGNLRVSPHFYNTEDEIDQFLAALP